MRPRSARFEPVRVRAVRAWAADAGQAAHIAEHAAGAIAIALRIAEHSKAIDNLRTALTSRSTIDQAIGILMAQQRCDARSAFALLRQASRCRNIKLARWRRGSWPLSSVAPPVNGAAGTS